jgi:exo-beta-1,3-glucanase (GH17 family)
LVFIFEAFDELWKGSNNPTDPEKNWGLYDENRRKKDNSKNKT